MSVSCRVWLSAARIPALVFQACLAWTLSTSDLSAVAQAIADGSPIKTPPAIQSRLDKLAARLSQAKVSDDRVGQASALADIGYIELDELRQTDKASETLQHGLEIARAADDSRDQAMLSLGLAVVDFRKNRYPQGIEIAEQELAVGRTLADREIEARALIVLGFGYDHENKTQMALESSRRAQDATEKISDPEPRLRTLLRLNELLRVQAEDGLTQLELMHTVANESLQLARTRHDSSAEARALYATAKTETLSGHPQAALGGYTQALEMLTSQEDVYGMRGVLLDRASTYRELNDLPHALEDVNRRAALLEQTGDTKAALQTRIFASDMLADLGRFDEALETAVEGVKGARAAHLRDVEAYALAVMGGLYYSLGDGQKALEATQQALQIRREIGPKNQEADALRVLGNIERDLLHDPLVAAGFFTQALQIYTSEHDQVYQVATLLSLCRVYSTTGEGSEPLSGSKALSYCTHGLSIARTSGNLAAEKEILLATGELYASLGNGGKALDLYNRALPLVASGGKPQEQSDLFFNLTKEYRRTKPDMAIFFGKQSINLLQQLRGNLKSQDEALQSVYLRNYEDRYRTLAAILIDQGRLLEAQQVLDLLKRRELVEYTRGAAGEPGAALELTSAEEQAAQDYQRTSQTLIAESEEFARLKKLSTRTPAQEAEYERLSAELASGSKGLNDFYARLFTLFGRNAQANKQLADVKGTASIVKQQIARSPHTVALWTLVTSGRVSILVITPTATVARETAIAEPELNRRVQEFRRVLQDPESDPRLAAQEMYRILVAPVQADLDQAAAQTLIWSLDGVLRYIPMAAMHDGKQYLVERYNSVNFTPTASTYLGDKPALNNIDAVAMGVSMQVDKSLTALPGVATELRQIVHDPQSATDGALPGAILLDSAFTEKGMEEKLNGQHQIVHIASHFVSQPGDDRRSYLLLAGKEMRDPEGFHLTVAEFRDDQRMSLENTDLFTLSACDTGLSRLTSDGREVDGLSATAQAKGAKAVLSTLWKVNDASTGEFMADFYRKWVDGGGDTMKVEAIRQAQMDLLLSRRKKGITPESGGTFTHPYFWAPFVLVGNWR